ncbi:P-loop containing nucleoside triphosphate hydrolase protein [Catenaria anguillulae PL171]|uniref:p-loop containing nucleoside triphosphate hydrolase protein n=1 Tax=Catenaria anguillulae PL171 TaxID=765915 RepID=A0A1Y2GZD7_9FUNG|nr:P-loop containing nucleoside triphosphate hydrolase protein [Catenaria anguillulae PL171]
MGAASSPNLKAVASNKDPPMPLTSISTSSPDHASPQDSSKILPDTRTSLLSRVLMHWPTKLMHKGYDHPLDLDDLYQLPPDLQASAANELFAHAWSHALESGRTHPLWRALYTAFGSRWLFSGFLNCISVTGQVSGPLLLRALLKHLETRSAHAGSTDQFVLYGIGWVVLLFGSQIATSLAHSHMFYTSAKTTVLVKSALVSAVYDKALKLSASARAGEFSAGMVTNACSTDTFRMEFFVPFSHQAWACILLILIILSILIALLGPSALVGLGVMLVMFPINTHFTRLLTQYRKQAQHLCDQRVKLTNESIQGIRVLKLMAWESPTLTLLTGLRDQELAYVKKTAVLRGLLFGFSNAIPALTALAVYATFAAAQGGKMEASLVFSTLTLFNLLRNPLTLLPTTLGICVDALVAVKRIQSILLAEETETLPELVAKPEQAQFAIQISRASFEWAQETSEAAKLTDVDLTVPKGQLLAIVGQVGSGKSNLLAGIVGEMRRVGGEVKIAGSMAYCPQQPWMQNATVRDNILFGKPFDELKYQRVIKQAALERDMDQLQYGDTTEIGEKGINLSGGQKARISLARALYTDSDIVLLDDITSALDSHVGAHVFHTTIRGALKHKTVLLVTHSLHFVPYCDAALVLKEGRVVEYGPVDDLLAREDGELRRVVNGYGAGSAGKQDAVTESSLTLVPDQLGKEEDVSVEDEVDTDIDDERTPALSQSTPPSASANTASTAVPPPTERRALMQAEERAAGSVATSVYLAYLRASGTSVAVALIVIVLIVSQLLRVGNDLWLTWWTSDKFGLPLQTYLLGYLAWSVVQAVSYMVTGLQVAYAGVRASAKMHHDALESVVRAPMALHETTPTGRIVARFSRDLDSMDYHLPESIRLFSNLMLQIVGSFGLMIYATPWFCVPFAPLLFIFYRVQLFFRSTSRELKRLDSLTRSPLFSQLGESLTGIVTIRAYGAESRFQSVNRACLDVNNRPQLIQVAVQRWLSIRLEFIAAMLCLILGVFGVMGVGDMSVALIGLCISYAMQTTMILTWCVRQGAELENQMNSVERIEHYAHNLDQEAPPVTDVRPPTPDWPAQGQITFDGVVLRYRPELEPSLRGVSFRVPGGAKVAFVGRTGSGKSTTLAALFRLVELAEGKIEVDGVDIAKMGLTDLRSRLAIVPQEPTLFSGTVRSQIDRDGHLSDAELWECLARAGLKSQIQALEGKLDAPIEEGGSNLSVGSRQLLCLARSMARRSNILVMDEASASVDAETDQQIQHVIRRDFAHATVLTIAHRLNTIIDYDLIAVLDAGQLMEFGKPSELLSNPESLFTALVNETGEESAAALKRIAFGESNVDQVF